MNFESWRAIIGGLLVIGVTYGAFHIQLNDLHYETEKQYRNIETLYENHTNLLDRVAFLEGVRSVCRKP